MSQQDHKDFFISYNGADQRWAEWIAWQLEEASYAVILQAWDFLPGSNFVVQMDRALTLAPRMIAVLSSQYLSALYTQPEWAAAFRHDPKGEQSLLIPVRVQPCEVTGLLGPIVYVDLVGQDEATARQRLLAAVRHERAKPAQAPAFPQTMQHTITRQLNFPGDLPPIWEMPNQRDPLFLGREQLLQELHTTLATDHHVLLFEPASEREAGTSGAIETAVEYAYRYRSDYQLIAWIQADSREALRSDLLSLAAELHLPQAHPSDQDPLWAVVQWLRTHQHWLLVLDQVQEKEVLSPLLPLPQQGHLLVVTSTRSLESLAPLIELSQVPWEERTVLTQLSQVVGAALQGPQGRIPLGLEPIAIGRASTNQVVLSDPSVSSRHAIIELKDQAYWITDKGSTNGTLLNQQRLVPQVPSQLHPGDTIQFGTITCTYEVIDRPSRSPVSSPSSEQGSTSTGAYAPSSPVIEKQQRDRVGQRFGNYRLSRLLGQGGFAEVYLGEHIFLDTQTAVKVLYTQLVGQDVEQFRQEARTIAHLEHPHIVRLLDFGIEGSTPYLIMSYAPNGTMRQRYPKGTRLPIEQVVSYVKQIAEALQYAHEHKIIHRDIKPENMLFGQDDQVVLSDFGIALVTQSSRFQQPNDMAGTIAYMAPEQIDAHPRPASDQYSLGIVVYEWLCGERPFHGSFKEIAVKQQLVAPPSLREKVPSLSGEVEQVVMTALAKDPKARFARVDDFAAALQAASQPAVAPLSTETTTMTTPPPVLSSSLPERAPSPLSPSSPMAAATPGWSPSASNGPTQPTQEPEITPSFPTPSAPLSNGKDADPPPTISAELLTASQDHAEELTPRLHAVPPTSPRRRSPRRVLLLVILAVLLIGSGILVYTTVRQNQTTTTEHVTATSNAQANSTSTAQANATAIAQAQANATATAQASIPGRTWHAQNSGTAQILSGVVWSGSQFVAVGKGGTILTSPDGRTWTTRHSDTTQYLSGVVWSGSQFVAVGGSCCQGPGGTILTSPDGRTWTTRHSDTTQFQDLYSVTWSGSQFVAVGSGLQAYGGAILTSPDGRTWTVQNSKATYGLQSVTWLGSQFVAMGGKGTILTSPDGRTWTAQHSGTAQDLYGVVWSGSQFVAVGWNGTILTSPDGHTWTTQNSGTSRALIGVAWSGSLFVVVGGTASSSENFGTILTSPDGHTWTTQNSGTSRALNSVACSSSRCVATGIDGNILTSP